MANLTAPCMNPNEAWWENLAGGDSRSALAMLETESSGGRYQRSVYELFAEMEEKDGHLYSVLQTRVNGLLGLERSVQPGGSSPRDLAAARFAEQALAAIPRFEELLHALLDALAKGFAAIELLWDYDAGGHLVITGWIAHLQEFFLFDARGELLLLTPPFRPCGTRLDLGTPAAGRTAIVSNATIRPPHRKFVCATFGRDARNPYGRGLAQRAYWYYWFKKNNLKFWAIYNEKFGAPTAVATYQPGTPDIERARLLDVLNALQTDNGVVVPETVSLRLLEAAGKGEGRTFREMADWCNDEISKIVLGATLTSSEGRRSGSLALGNVHDAVRQDYIESDARWLGETVNTTIVRWLAELNFPGTAPPAWSVDATPPEDLEQQIRIDRELVGLGVPVPASHFYERYGRPVPKDAEHALRYDDSNLFQYHVRYGVLTINEIRQRLNLPPVPWGNRPATEPTGAPLSQTGTESDPPAAGDAEDRTGEQRREVEKRDK